MSKKQTERKHTPLPWNIGLNPDVEGMEFNIIGADRLVICTFPFSTGDEDGDAVTEEDVKFIVLACNNHYKLVDAMKHMLGWFEHSDIARSMTQLGQQADYHAVIRQAREALANATPPSPTRTCETCSRISPYDNDCEEVGRSECVHWSPKTAATPLPTSASNR